METTIFILIIAMLIIVFAYILSKLDDRLLKERNTAKNLRNELNKAQEENAWLRFRIGEEKRETQKAIHKIQALQVDYERLLTDYHILEQENEK